MSPELLTEKAAGFAADLWALGCIIYQFIAGRPPFKAVNEYQTFQKIINRQYSYPDGFPEVVKDICEKLLVLLAVLNNIHAHRNVLSKKMLTRDSAQTVDGTSSSGIHSSMALTGNPCTRQHHHHLRRSQ